MHPIFLRIRDAGLDGAIRFEDGLATISISGDVDVSNLDVFRSALVSAEGFGPRGIIVSLENMTHLSARAIRVLSEFGARVKADHGCKVVILCPERHFVLRMIELLGYPHEVATNMDEAFSALNDTGSGPMRSEGPGQNAPST